MNYLFTKSLTYNITFVNNFVSFKEMLFFLKKSWLVNVRDYVQAVATLLYWVKIRSSYLVKSWVYTTNHKRISINYFSFIFVSGTAGLGLATVVRMEFAYPGVGVFAGDSLQYLSIATAHGVIMVFFMIMPTLFGAFGNFLLPTQLGVHDVAFPRLNSAAFWFLPGGLIMLAQLVCIDRRYQRMNCFNIRELQSMLKQRFYSDLVNSHDHKTLLNSTLVGLRYKLLNSESLSPDMQTFYNFGITFLPKYRSETYYSLLVNDYAGTISSLLRGSFAYVCDWLTNLTTETSSEISSPTPFYDFFMDLRFFIEYCNFYVYKALIGEDVLHPIFMLGWETVQSFKSVNLFLFGSFNFDSFRFSSQRTNLSNFYTYYISYFSDFRKKNQTTNDLVFSYSSNKLADLDNLTQFSLNEVSNSLRFIRFSNPLINYNYKSGHYLTIWDKLYPSLMTTFIEVTKNVTKPSWLFSDKFTDLLKLNLKNFNNLFLNSINNKRNRNKDWYQNQVQAIYPYFNLTSSLDENFVLNNRWVALNTLNQKFSKMFTSASTQQRILANWRQLKFSREAWRCKLLVSRYQNTIYRRFLGEESLVWSIDRNAKDLLPGWAMITPFSARTRYTAIGKTDIGLMGVLLVLNSSIVSSANFLVTYRYLSTLNNRKMRDARSFFTESLIVASWMMIAANPMLVIAIVMLLFDRHWQTSFFDYSGGGDTVLFQHMFWFFGHPEVYVIMIPVFGFTNTVMSYYLRKRISARSSLMYSMYTIAFLGFFVWGHHMYMVGLAHTTRMLFSTLTVMISIPAATKLMHWAVTIVNSYFTMEIPFLWTLSFIYFFISGGVSGMCVAHVGMDVLLHDTFYVIGHFHVMLAGSAMMGIFSAFYFYFPAMYGVKYSRVYAYIHYIYYVIGQFLTVVPMLWLGYCGMPRRVLDYPSVLGGWHSLATAGHLLSVFAMLSFFIMIFDSIRQAKPTIRTNFGVGRFNTRLNFYFFEISRLNFIQRKSFYNYRFFKDTSGRKIDVNLLDLVNSESTLFSYRFFK